MPRSRAALPSRPARHAGRRWTAALGLSLALAPLAGAGCAPETTEAPEAAPSADPADAVLRVAGLPLTAAEVAPLAADIRVLYPEYSELHARRLALTNEFLPRLAARAQDPEGWRRAREACAAAQDLERLAVTAEGTFHGLGVGLWSLARHLPEGQWSEPLELAGRWVRLRLEAREPHAEARLERLRLALAEFAFVPTAESRARLDQAVDRATLTLLDPAFAEAVPETWKHRMRATTP
jgi:hypothetical protein